MFRSGSAGVGFQRGDLRPRPSAISLSVQGRLPAPYARSCADREHALPAAGYATPGGTPRGGTVVIKRELSN